ncbi:hypothetical protein F0562_017978 [Nyssa sinensis]|uniref:Uncharacterized protein n=1 Tax=Nyssa sinensis TaxID=561372 RepID=A0A5J4ZA34_9ASTE|nr:hypothetical protein F0562_017978 [Nyssa sinensis]
MSDSNTSSNSREAAQVMATILDYLEDTERVSHLQAELEKTRTELEASRASTHSLEEKYNSLDGKYKKAVANMGAFHAQRNKFVLRMEAMKKDHREAEIAAAQKLQFNVEVARTAAREETKKEMMDEKLYLNLDISRVDDIEVEASEPPSLEPTPVQSAEGAVVEDAVPILAVPHVTLE